ncbi:FtsX-like permease family protein [Actinomadura terrae]|uniref:FtsX-like permease family protein n=1 Tax=Actinomadura terrae TaxID=604353 RepID=UPI001FA8193F|nr:ABC transporter permease [Actinomadura terrae]
MLCLALSTVRTRRFGFAGSFVAVVLAVALVFAWFTLLISGKRSAPAADRFGAAAAVVRMDPALTVLTGSGENVDRERLPLDQPPRLPGGVAERLRTVPGVRSVIADTPFYAQVVDRHGTPLAGPRGGPSSGHAWQAAELTPFRLRTGRAPRGPDEVVLDADAARRAGTGPGDAVRVVTAQGVRNLRVSGVASPPGAPGLPSRTTLFFAGPVQERPRFLGVIAEPGTPPGALAGRVRAALRDPGAPRGAQVLSGRDASRAGSPEVGERLEYATQFLGPMGGIGLFLAVFVIAGTFGLSILQRSREIALLRAVGSTPWQIRRLLVAEAFAVSLAAGLPGCLLGLPVAHLVRRLMVGNSIAPPDLRLQVGPAPFAIAIGAGLLVTLPAVLLSAHHAARVRATEALREAAAPRRIISVPRLLLALAALAGATAVHALSQHVGGEVGVAFQYLTVMILMAAAALASPLLTRVLTPPVGALLRAVSRDSGWLAAAAARAEVRRVASAAASVMMCAALGSAALLISASIESTAVGQSQRRVVADRVLTARDAPGLPAATAAGVRGLPGVAAASPPRSTTFVSTVLGSPDTLVAQGVDPASIGQVLDPGVRAGSLAALAGPGTVAVSRTHARERDWGLGDRVRGWLGDGTPVDLRIVAVYDRSLGLGDFLIARTALDGHLHEPLDDAVLVRGRPGVDLDRALHGIAAATPTVRVMDAPAYARLSRSGLSQSTTHVYIVLGLLVAFSAVSIVNTSIMGTAERAREFALLRLVGASRGQVVRTICMETAAAALIGTIVGSLIGLVALAGATGALTGTPSLHVPLARYALVPAGVALLGLLVSALPSAMVLRYRPVEALGRRE